MFIPLYREGGGPIEARPFYIATGEVIEKGEMVQLTVGAGVTDLDEGTDLDDPIFGVAAEDHDGSTAGRQKGLEILVYCDIDIVYGNIPKTLSTADSGTATTWVDAELTAADDIFNGGKVVIVDPNSVAGFSAGDVLDITDFANATGTVTVTAPGGTIDTGMTGYIYPGKLAVGSVAFDLDANGTNIDLKTAGGQSLVIVGAVWDGKKKETMVMCKIRLHQFGSGVVAID